MKENNIVGETAVSTSIPILLVEAGIITSEAATSAGVIVCIIFLMMHLLESDNNDLEKGIELLHSYMIDTENILKTPVALKFKTKRAVWTKPRGLLDPPGGAEEVQIYSANEFTIEEWDGMVIGALGEALQYGEFKFEHFSKSGIEEFYNELKNKF